jgi:hypothetical protein
MVGFALSFRWVGCGCQAGWGARGQQLHAADGAVKTAQLTSHFFLIENENAERPP